MTDGLTLNQLAEKNALLVSEVEQLNKKLLAYEQAAVLHVLLNLYIKHGNDWRKYAEEAFTPAVAQENE